MKSESFMNFIILKAKKNGSDAGKNDSTAKPMGLVWPTTELFWAQNIVCVSV